MTRNGGCATIFATTHDPAEIMPTDGLPMLPSHHLQPRLYAGFWRRAAALLIDVVVFSAIHWIVVLCFGVWLMVPWTLLGGGTGRAMAGLVDFALQPFGIVVVWLYFAVCESSPWQATIGKLALGLRVTDLCGLRVGFAQASGRYFAKFVSLLSLGVGFLLAAWTARKQALHDLMAGCCVLRKAGMAAEESGDGATAPAFPPRQHGLPGWGIALVVLGACVFLVLPVAGFLAAFVAPAYQSHVLRGQVAEGLALTERARALVGEYIGERGMLPEDNRALGLPKPEALHARYVTSVRVAGGKVVVTYGNEADAAIRGGHVVISPVGNAARLRWHCSSPDIRGTFLPAGCRD